MVSELGELASILEGHKRCARLELYGMKQGRRIWNKTMDTRMKEMGFTQISVEHCLYMQTTEVGTTIAAVHVDDFTVASSTCEEEH